MQDDLPAILRWRNRPQVREVMFTDHEITWEEHHAWWCAVQADPARDVRLFVEAGRACAVVTYYDIDRTAGSCQWGFFLADDLVDGAARLAIWLAVEREAIDHARRQLGCRTLHCETLATNDAVLAVHARFGFRETGRRTLRRGDLQLEVVEMVLGEPRQDPRETDGPEDAPGPELTLAVLGSANWDLFNAELRDQAAGRVSLRLLPVPFGQYRARLVDADSALRTTPADVYVFAERFEDLLPAAAVYRAALDTAIEAAFDAYLALLDQARADLPGRFIVFELAPVAPQPIGLVASADPGGLVGRLNRRLRAWCDAQPDCLLLGVSTLVQRVGQAAADPGKYWLLARQPFALGFCRELARMLLGVLQALHGQTIRALVVDLDNTLWGGVIGDDGIDGIALGGDHPGNAFTRIQSALQALQAQGLLLAICSRNTESIALDAIQRHPDMLLRLDDFAARRIDWRDKPVKIRELAVDLNIGLEALCVIDDSPYERQAIRSALPQVYVPELPADPAQWVRALLADPRLARLPLTQADVQRAAQYRARAAALASRSAFDDRDAYLANLEMVLGFARLGPGNRQRVLQLLNKTNQFNLTGTRYTEQDLASRESRGGEVIAVSLADRFSEREIIGVCILCYPREDAAVAELENFVLSCRVLGRTVETAVLAWLVARIGQRGCARLDAHYRDTQRNLPARDFLAEHRFDVIDECRHCLSIENAAISIPSYMRVLDQALPGG